MDGRHLPCGLSSRTLLNLSLRRPTDGCSTHSLRDTADHVVPRFLVHRSLSWPRWLWVPSTPSPYESILSSVFSIFSYITQPLLKREVQTLLGDATDRPRSYYVLSVPDVKISLRADTLSDDVAVDEACDN